jgi:hypothetical protein
MHQKSPSSFKGGVFNVPKLYFETDQGGKFEILKGSHITFRQTEKEDEIFCAWETVVSIHEDLNEMLTQGEEMLKRVKQLLETHPSVAVAL